MSSNVSYIRRCAHASLQCLRHIVVGICDVRVVTLSRYKIAQIVCIHRRFTDRLPGLADLTYDDRWSLLKADSLDLRWLRLDLIYVNAKYLLICLRSLILDTTPEVIDIDC